MRFRYMIHAATLSEEPVQVIADSLRPEDAATRVAALAAEGGDPLCRS